MGMTNSMNRHGIIQMSWDLTSGLYTDAASKKMVKNTKTPIERIDAFTLTFPIFIGQMFAVMLLQCCDYVPGN